jgi:hypothetical protein
MALTQRAELPLIEAGVLQERGDQFCLGAFDPLQLRMVGALDTFA